jgi:hypothetical protein
LFIVIVAGDPVVKIDVSPGSPFAATPVNFDSRHKQAELNTAALTRIAMGFTLNHLRGSHCGVERQHGQRATDGCNALSQFDLFSEVITQRSEHDNGVLLSGLDIAAEPDDSTAESVVEQIARERHLVCGTIYGHLAEAIESGERLDLNRLVTTEQQKEIAAAFDRLGFGSLGAVREDLKEKFEYGILRVYRAHKNLEGRA